MAALPKHLDDYRREIEASIAEIRRDLAPLESGEMQLRERTGNTPWRDTTAETIAQHKRTLGIFEAILAALNKRELG